MEYPTELSHSLHIGDGYHSKPMWTQEENMHVFYDYEMDRQCMISGSTIEELIKKLKIKYDNY